MEEIKCYRSNEEGKRAFTDEVLAPLTINEGHFAEARYVTNDSGEYIMLYRHNEWRAAYAIDITADSIEALARDFIRRLLKCIEKEEADEAYHEKFDY